MKSVIKDHSNEKTSADTSHDQLKIVLNVPNVQSCPTDKQEKGTKLLAVTLSFTPNLQLSDSRTQQNLETMGQLGLVLEQTTQHQSGNSMFSTATKRSTSETWRINFRDTTCTQLDHTYNRTRKDANRWKGASSANLRSMMFRRFLQVLLTDVSAFEGKPFSH